MPDLQLTGADARDEAPFYVNGQLIRPEVRDFGLGYGDCTIPAGRDSCTIPLTKTIDPPEHLPVADEVKTGRTVYVRGMKAEVLIDGDLYISTPAFGVQIGPAGGTPDEVLKRAIGAAQQLVGANLKAANITRLTDFEGNPLVPPEGSTPMAPSPTTTPPTPGPTVAAPLPIATAYYPAVTSTPEPAATAIAILPTTGAAP